MAESAVVKAAREFREQLARNEDQALKRMARTWVGLEREVEEYFRSLAYDVRDMMSNGQPVPLQYLYTLQRYRSMMAQIQREMPNYQRTVEDLIKGYQRENYILGIDAANAIIRETKPSSDVWTRVYKDAAETMVGFAGNGTPLMKLLETDYGKLSSEIADALISGVGLGKGVNAVVKDMLDAMSGDYDRALRIARTEINRAYRLANAQQYARSGVVEKVIRLCYPPTACFACLMMDGEECPNGICDDHPNGKCTTIVQTIGGEKPTWETGREWFEKQDPAKQMELMGKGRFFLWKNGVPLNAMVTMRENPVWGGSPTMVTLSDLIAQFGIVPGLTRSSAAPAPAPAPSVPATGKTQAIETIKKADWYKSAVGVSKDPDELTRVIDGMSEEQAKVFANGLTGVKKVNFKSNRGYVSPWDKSVNVPLNNPAGKDTAKGYKTAIGTTFHELTHAVDLLNPKTVSGMQGLRGKIEECAIEWANGLLRKAGVPEIKSFARLSKDQRRVVSTEMLMDVEGYHSVSDIFEGLTNDRISGGYGHGKDYWKRGLLMLEKEFVAHSGQAWVTKDRFTEVFGDAQKMVVDEMVRLYGQ